MPGIATPGDLVMRVVGQGRDDHDPSRPIWAQISLMAIASLPSQRTVERRRGSGGQEDVSTALLSIHRRGRGRLGPPTAVGRHHYR
jgi:hypothetical protein